MKKLIAAVLSALVLLCAAGCAGTGKAGYTDIYSGAQSISKEQAERIASLGKCIEGQRLVVTANVSEYAAAFNGFEYMVFTIDADKKTNTVLTWRFCADEQAYNNSLAELSKSASLKITSFPDELVICYGTAQARDGDYGVIRSGLENDTIRDYIFVE